MIIQTRDFGEVSVEDEDIVTFVQPIFGFEHLTQYIFLFNQGDCSQFVWLQSIEDQDICFILADKSVLTHLYNPVLTQQSLKVIGEGDYIVWLMVVVDTDFSKSTVNLKSPIILNPVQKKAMQVILEQNHPIKYPLIPKEKDEI